jgi:protocatechuate 3,4-dioxygenase beta subunit
MRQARIACLWTPTKEGNMFLGDRFSILLPIILLGAFTVAGAQTSRSDYRPRTASISGRVTISGKAAANAKIVITEIKGGSDLSNQDFPLGSQRSNAGDSYIVLTDAEGRYRQANLPEGRYETQAMLRGYVKQNRSSRELLFESFSLNEGESRENVDFTLVRGGVITGRVTDADGRPLIAGLVSLQIVDDQGVKTDALGLREMADQERKSDMFQTDDRGIYRIYGVRAGRYLVSAGGDSNSARRFLTGAGGDYPRTWYPDATNENQAKIVKVDAGGEVTGVDIKLGDAKRTYDAAGRVIDDETSNPIPGSDVVYVKLRGGNENAITDSDAFEGFGGKAKTDEQGNFRLVGLAPGRYLVSIGDHESFLTGAGSYYYSDGAKLEIQGSDVAGVEIRAKRGATISGVAVVEAADPSARQALSRMMIMAEVSPSTNRANEYEIASTMSPVVSRIGSDGGFMLKGVRPGNVTLQVGGMTESPFKVLRIERGGAQISDGIPVTGREDITGVLVILGDGSGVIRGQVTITGGQLPAGFQLEVSAERVKDSISARFSESSMVDNRGRFVIEGLLPGEWVLTLQVIPSPGADLNALNGLNLEPVTQKVSLARGQESQVAMTFDLSKKDQEEK